MYSDCFGETMQNPQAKDDQQQYETTGKSKKQEPQTQARSETVLNQIEDATYAILRKHEKQSA